MAIGTCVVADGNVWGQRSLSSRDRHDIAMALFERVCDLPPAERDQELREACADDPELRRQVETLLLHDSEANPFVAAAESGKIVADFMADTGSASPDGAALPDCIGPYRIVRKIGSGGMGIIYEAQQESPRRRVALKILRADVINHSTLKRFERETHVLGQLQHPGIARIYEAGYTAEKGPRQPFFAMEFIDGEPLDVYAKAQQLDIRQRLKLIAQVADAVQHAHQKGIIHRDLKPNNILVVAQRNATSQGTTTGHDEKSRASAVIDSLGQPTILDFGIARVTDADIQTVTVQTEIGQLVGTLAYMSPEQVMGISDEIDTRSDIYALGVILYELVTGRRPHDLAGHTVPEAVRILRDVDPSTVSSLDNSLRGDVDTIIAKAMDKDRDRRYASASDLASDIRRYLKDEPIEARPASAFYQLRKFARRNRGLVGGLVTTFAVLVLGLLGTARGLYEAKQAQARLEVVVDFQAEQLSDIRPEKVGRDMIEDLRGEFLRDIEKEGLSEGARQPELDSLERVLERVNPTNLAREVMSGIYLDRAQERLDDKFTDDPIVEADLRNSLAFLCFNMGMYEQCLDQRTQVLALRRQHLGPRHLDTLNISYGVGGVLREMGRLAEAETYYRETLDGLEDVLGENHEDTLMTRHGLADLLRLKGETEEAERIYRELIDRRTKQLGEDHTDTISAMNNLGVTLLDRGQTGEALVWMNRALEARMRTKGADHPMTIRVRNNVVAALLKANRLEEARVIAREVVASYSRVKGDQHPNTIRAQNNLGMVVFRGGDPDGAEPHLRTAYELSRQHLQPTHEVRTTSASNLVDALLELSRPKEAETYCRELLAVRRALDPPRPQYVARSLEQLGRCLFDQGISTDAEVAFRECLTIREGIKIDHWLTNLARSLLGASIAGQARFAQAEPLLVNAQADLTAARDDIPSFKRDDELAAARRRVIELYEAWDKPEEAAKWLAETRTHSTIDPQN